MTLIRTSSHIPVSAAVWLIAGVIFGSMFGSRYLQEAIDLYNGYRWNYVEKCIINPGNFAGGYCRMPKECTCTDVDSIDDIQATQMTPELFKDRYLRTNRPVVVRNVSLNWEAMKVLDYSWLKAQYTKSEEILQFEAKNCFFKCYKTEEFPTLASVFTMSEERVSDVLSRPWYVGWSVCHQPVLREIEKLIELPEFLSDLDMLGNMWIFIGSPGYGAHLHLDDDLELPTWQAQISGVKTWFLQPPPECGGRCKKELQTDLHPGDMIIVNTNFWFHKTRVKDQGISLVVTQQVG